MTQIEQIKAKTKEYPIAFRDEIDKFLFKECNIMGGCCSAQGNFAYMIGREVAEKAIKFAKEQMMKDAVDGQIVHGGNDEKVVRHPTRWMASHDTPLPRHIIDKYHIGDKVKLIIFPSDNE